MDGFLVFLGYYFLAGVITRVVVYLLAEFGVIGPRFRTVGIEDHLLELFLTAILWPLFIVTFVIEFPGYLHSISPEGKAEAAQRAREEIEAKLAPWVPEEWLREVCPEEILQEEVYEGTWPLRVAFRKKIEPGDEVRFFTSPPPSWSEMRGRAGLAIVRNGKPIAQIVLMKN